MISDTVLTFRLSHTLRNRITTGQERIFHLKTIGARPLHKRNERIFQNKNVEYIEELNSLITMSS